MGVGIFNIVIGIVAILGALRGETLIFTNSSTAALVVGSGIAAFGLYQVATSRPRG